MDHHHTTVAKPGLKTAAVALTLALGVTACAAPAATSGGNDETISVEHAQGTTDVPVNPEKVFTFDLGVLDSLDELDVDVAGVPEAIYPEPVKEAAEEAAVKIGTMKEPDFEKINAEAPDLIIITGRTADSYEELSKIAPTINLSLDNNDVLGSFEQQVQTLGKIFDKEDVVEEELSELSNDIEEAKAAVSEAGKGLIVMTSAGELTAYGEESRFGLIHQQLGIEEAATVKAEGAHGQSVSFEFLAQTNPDLLFVVDRDSAVGESGHNAKATLDNALVSKTKAAKNEKIVYLDSGTWYIVGPGLGTLDDMIEEVVEGTK